MQLISLIVPSYNEEDNILPFYKRVVEVFSGTYRNVELIFVDDGSTDSTYKKIKELAIRSDPGFTVKGISFSRNFGKESAMLAGLKSASGDYIAFIDADLQQDPLYVSQMVKILYTDPDVDIVCACQRKRIEGRAQSFLKNCFYRVINLLSDVHFENNVSDFRVFRKSVKDAILSLPETERFSKGIFAWVGFRTYCIDYDVKERASGKTHWSLGKLFRYACDGIADFSDAGLHIAFPISLLMFVAAVASFFLFSYVPALILLIGALQMLVTGIIGDYLGRTYGETKRRPSYIVREKCSSSKKRRCQLMNL
ncbi:MAG: glycosyltransferase family 2 protein [Candidatus Weimeria sp.]